MLDKAKRGNKGALIALYDANKDKAYYIAYGLLQDKAAAGNAVEWAFQDVISLLEGVEGEAAFAALIEKRVVKNCRKKMEAKGNQRKFPSYDEARAAQLSAEFSDQAVSFPDGVDRAILNSIAIGVKAQKASEKLIPGWVFGVAAVAIAVVAALVIVLFGGQKSAAPSSDVTSQTYTAAIEIEDYGTITLELDGETAPNTVENFVGLAKSGFYDGLTFHRIMEDFMMQGGDPDGNGTGGESVWGEPFEDEFNKNLLNLDGSVSMANKGANTNRSQFFINFTGNAQINWDNYEQGYSIYKQAPDAFTSTYGKWLNMDEISDEVREAYDENGGNPHLDGAYSTTGEGHTVFAQVFEGMDYVAKLITTETDENDKPLTDIVMESVEIVVYE